MTCYHCAPILVAFASAQRSSELHALAFNKAFSAEGESVFSPPIKGFDGEIAAATTPRWILSNIKLAYSKTHTSQPTRLGHRYPLAMLLPRNACQYGGILTWFICRMVCGVPHDNGLV
jgi:hypothetical protein